MGQRDPDRLIRELRGRLDELETVAREISTALDNKQVPASDGKPGDDRARQRAAGKQFRLVVVCTGNRVRSPIGEAFLRQLLADLPVSVESLGTLDLGPVPPLPEAIETASLHGLDITSHCARTLQGEDLSNADLVVGFERKHVAAAVVDCGAPRERVFTIGELVALLQRVRPVDGSDPVARARQALSRAAALRRADVELPELADPLGGSAEVYRDTVTAVRGLCEELAAGLFGRGAVRPLPESIEQDRTPAWRRAARLGRG